LYTFSGEKLMPNCVEASPIFSTFALRSLQSKAGLFLCTHFRAIFTGWKQLTFKLVSLV
jgi:hypothetical protein